MKTWSKRLGLIFAVMVICYLGSVSYYYWQWMTPKTDFPANLAVVGAQKIYRPSLNVNFGDIEKLAEERVQQWSVPSLSLAIGIDGELAYALTRGFADIENAIPANVSHRYRIGSVSKSLTALALARLYDAKQIELDAPITNYLPDLPRYYQKVSAQMLGNHTAGVRHYGFDMGRWPPHEFFIDQAFEDVEQSLSLFVDDELLFEPGVDFQYSSYGYNLLSAVMEKSAGTDYLKLMAEAVFTPLDMQMTGIEGDSHSSHDVKYYISGESQYGQAYPVDLSMKWASGGFMSTPSDLVKAGNVLLGGSYLSPQSKALILLPVEANVNGQDPMGYALGWEVNQSSDILKGRTVEVIFHSGGSVGGKSYLMVIPEYKITIALQSNTSGSRDGPYLQALAHEIAALLIE
jgi:serine beta-lactamase-like protein LACTB, mitochondrial